MPRLQEFVARHRPLIAILVVGFVIRFIWLLYAHPDPVSDYWVYYRMGENILDEGFIGVDGPSALLLPAHPILLAGLMLVSRNVWWLSFAMVLLSTAACLLIYFLVRRLTGRELVALVATAISAVSPGFVVYSPVLGTEHLFVVLMLGTILVTLSLAEHTRGRAVAAGVLAGLAVMTRGEMVFYLPVLLGLIWFGLGIIDPMKRMRLIALFVGAMTLVVSPWLIRNSEVIDPAVGLSTVSGMNFWFAHHAGGYGFTEEVPWPKGDDVSANRIGWELGLAHVRDHPVSILESIREGTFRLFSWPEYALISSTQDAIPGKPLEWNTRYLPFENTIRTALLSSSALLLSLALASFLTWPMWGRGLRILIVGFILASWFGHAVLFFGHPRFRYSLDVLFTALAAITIVGLWERGRLTDPRPNGTPVETA